MVLEAFADLPVALTTGKTTSSVVGVLRGARPGPTYLLRGDMDGLPVHEDTGLPFTSEVPGAMHACGHDTHTAMLSSAARLLSARRDEIPGRVLFMFQPGEEGEHGAQFMLDEGLLDLPPLADGTASPVTGAFALHITSTLPSGMVSTKGGPAMASADRFEIVVKGAGAKLVALLDRAQGRIADPRLPFVPPPRYAGQLELPAAVEDVEALAFALNRLIFELAGWLLGRGLGILEMSLMLIHERHRVAARASHPAERDQFLLVPAHLLSGRSHARERATLSVPAIRAVRAGIYTCDCRADRAPQ
jgi:hypothetical protein